jgi:Predicted transcriptional regulator, contains C-terminal CBS domains
MYEESTCSLIWSGCFSPEQVLVGNRLHDKLVYTNDVGIDIGRRKIMRIADLMIKDVILIHADDTIEKLIKLLAEKRVGGVPVIGADSKLVGFVSDGDIFRALMPKHQAIYDVYSMISAVRLEITHDGLRNLLEGKVSNVMNRKHLYSVRSDNDLDAALKQMGRVHIKKLPVVNENNQVIGIISRSDIIRYIVGQAFAGK